MASIGEIEATAQNTKRQQKQHQIKQEQQSSQNTKVPPALRPLLEAFARETLRNQPADLLEFGRCFFETLSHYRQKHGPDSWETLLSGGDKTLYSEHLLGELQKKLEALKSTTTANSSENNAGNGGGSPVSCAARRQQQQRPASPMDVAATKIQAAFRGHMLRAHPEKFGLDTLQINGINHQQRRQKMRRSSNERLEIFDTRKDLKRHSIGGYSHALQLTATPEDRAATKIQAEIRGFLTRKHLEHAKKQNEEAATKIQAHIRGYLTRKHLEEQGVLVSPPRSRTSTNAGLKSGGGVEF